ncbi:MAG: lysyl oxidase family protein [Actinomycetota bacterium]
MVAVIDGNFSPYHWDFLGSKMPQHEDSDPDNDLPLDQPPDSWISGFPSTAGFSSYDSLDLSLEQVEDSTTTASLQAQDTAEWNKVKQSDGQNVHYYWAPDTKIVGAVRFGSPIQSTNAAHGANTSSVSVGNFHGTCPECVVVLITYNPGGCTTRTINCPQLEYALNWAMSQPWIDVVTNSYGFSPVERERIYDGGNAAQQAAASERGQTIFYSSGNGVSNTFTIPNTTLLSSQEGPDWTVTVGAVHQTSHASYTGSGKPADVASVGGGYPSLGGTTVSGTDRSFGGTSNATPVVAGMYANALLQARRALPGPSRTQQDGLVATGASPVACGAVRPDCELGDGVLTAAELRTRLLHGAVHTPQGLSPGTVNQPVLPPLGEDEFLSEGHGTYFGRLDGDEAWQTELDRITGPLFGTAAPTPRPNGEREWMIVDSFCRQALWGRWSDGYYVDEVTQLPPDNPAFPVRTAMRHGCERALFDQLPNLVPLKPADAGVGSTDDGTGEALRFSVSTANRGRFALDLTAVPNAGFPQTSDAYQCVMWTTDRVCQERTLVGTFTFHEAHTHYHFEDYALYELRRFRANGEPDMSPGGLAAPGFKASFCLIDYDQDRPPDSPIYELPHPLYLTCTGSFGVGVQGISPGWKDTYDSSLPGQQIPIAGVPRGQDYALVITADPENQLWETNEEDNVAWSKVRL